MHLKVSVFLFYVWQCKENVLLVTQSYKNIHYFEIQNSYHRSVVWIPFFSQIFLLCGKENRDCTDISPAHSVLSRGMSTWKLPCKGRAGEGGRVTQVTCLHLMMSFMPGWLKSLRKSCFKGHHHWFLSAAAVEVNELVLSWFLPINIDVEKLSLTPARVRTGQHSWKSHLLHCSLLLQKEKKRQWLCMMYYEGWNTATSKSA